MNEPTACDITVVIITFNEAIHVGRAIDSVRSFASDVLVVDSYSTDSTVAICESKGARVLQNKFVNYSDQFQWALDNGGIKSAWTLRLDADEVVEEDLSYNIKNMLTDIDHTIVGVNFNRKHYFMGKWVKHGGRYPLKLLRLWRTGSGRIEARWMDEHIVVSGGETITIPGGFSDRNEKDLSFFTSKHNSYATREAIDVLSRKYNLLKIDDSLNSASSSRQASLKRQAKEKIYNKMPLWMGPSLYFIWRYIFQFGFLDGSTGTMYHVLQGFWYRYLVACKIYEYDMSLSKIHSRNEKLHALSVLTGYDLFDEDVGK